MDDVTLWDSEWFKRDPGNAKVTRVIVPHGLEAIARKLFPDTRVSIEVDGSLGPKHWRLLTTDDASKTEWRGKLVNVKDE